MRMRKITVMFLLVAAVGVLGVSVASAFASEFESEGYNSEVKATATNDQGFEITGAVAVCKNATFNSGTITGNSASLEVHPEYTNCKVELGGNRGATVTSTGCNFVFHTAGTVDVKCETGKEIHVHVEELNCEINVGTQTGLGTVTYENVNESSWRTPPNPPWTEVKVKANVTGISYTTNCAGIASSGSTGEYRQGKLKGTEEEPEMGTEAAKATAKGFKAGSTQQGVRVN